MANIDPSAYLAPSAVVVGDVSIGADSSVWHNATIRADIAPIRIGQRTNVQDGAVLHVSAEHPVTLGNDVTIGHNATVHGCTVGDGSLIGMGAIVLDGAQVGTGCLVAAGALVTPGTVLPDHTMALGNPAHVVRPTNARDRAMLAHGAEEYVRLAHAAMEPAELG